MYSDLSFLFGSKSGKLVRIPTDRDLQHCLLGQWGTVSLTCQYSTGTFEYGIIFKEVKVISKKKSLAITTWDNIYGASNRKSYFFCNVSWYAWMIFDESLCFSDGARGAGSWRPVRSGWGGQKFWQKVRESCQEGADGTNCHAVRICCHTVDQPLEAAVRFSNNLISLLLIISTFTNQ